MRSYSRSRRRSSTIGWRRCRSPAANSHGHALWRAGPNRRSECWGRPRHLYFSAEEAKEFGLCTQANKARGHRLPAMPVAAVAEDSKPRFPTRDSGGAGEVAGRGPKQVEGLVAVPHRWRRNPLHGFFVTSGPTEKSERWPSRAPCDGLWETLSFLCRKNSLRKGASR